MRIDAAAILHAPFAVIRDTLTDYDHLADFIPGMRASRVVSRQGKTAVVEQSGYAHLWFFHFPINVTLQAVDESPSVIDVHLVKGNLKQLDGRYDIEKDTGDDTYTLHWNGVVQPGAAIPDFIAVPLLRSNIGEEFRGMVEEIERRAAQAAAPRG